MFLGIIIGVAIGLVLAVVTPKLWAKWVNKAGKVVNKVRD